MFYDNIIEDRSEVNAQVTNDCLCYSWPAGYQWNLCDCWAKEENNEGWAHPEETDDRDRYECDAIGSWNCKCWIPDRQRVRASRHNREEKDYSVYKRLSGMGIRLGVLEEITNCTTKDGVRNWAGIMLNERYISGVIEVKSVSDRVMCMKLKLRVKLWMSSVHMPRK